MQIVGLVPGLGLTRSFARWSLVAALLFAGAACHREGDNQDDAGVDVDLAGAPDLADADLTNGPDLACTPEVQSCTGLCGPVRDNCTGMTFQCGACAMGTVCDLDAHVCITPKTDCTQLGKVCGTTKNSCGQTISCTPFNCTDPTQECNPDTNQCVACEAATCEDLGYECGQAWLGCGPQSNTTDCGTCGAGKTCNDALHVCEPSNGGTCGGMTAKQMCDAAAAGPNKVECGVITNGCGGLIDCTTTDAATYTCRAGTFCGGAGVPNRCAPAEPPSECFVAGYNCGTLPSACGGTVDCGKCTAPDICNLASGSMAGTCGPACTMPMKSCAVEYAGMCGQALDNNCWPKLGCPCATGVCSTSVGGATGTCGAVKMCTDYTSGLNGQPCSIAASSMFPKGDGSNLNCGCANPGAGPGQETCLNPDPTTHVGSCCTRKTCGVGDTKISDGCGSTIDCCAANGHTYNPTTMMCCDPGDPCNNAFANKYGTGVVDGCGNLVFGTGICDCSRYAATPDNPDSGSGNACCAHPTCGGVCDGSTKAATCKAADTVTCGAGSCGGSKVCNGGTCCTPATCPNDNTYHAAFVQGCGLPTKVCDCNRFATNKVDPDIAPADGTIDDGGACCAAATCPANACAASTPGAACNANVKTTCGVTCSGTSCCNGAACVTKATCPAAPGCEKQLPNNCGGFIDCNCTSPATCSTSANGVLGTCNCPAKTCVGCNPATQSNACGSTAACGCSGGQICGVSGLTCCTAKTCAADLPAGAQCGHIDDSACSGTAFDCTCPIAGKPRNACNTGNGQCECAPVKCCKDTGGVQPCIQPGSYGPSLAFPDHNDGCGNSGTCSS